MLDQGGAFAAETTSRAAYAPAPGKSGEELAAAARRQDIFLKHVKYGKSAVMPTDKTGFFASTSQLSYGWCMHAAQLPAVPPLPVPVLPAASMRCCLSRLVLHPAPCPVDEREQGERRRRRRQTSAQPAGRRQAAGPKCRTACGEPASLTTARWAGGCARAMPGGMRACLGLVSQLSADHGSMR